MLKEIGAKDQCLALILIKNDGAIMRHNVFYLLIILNALMIPSALAADTYTMTTYYPAPNGKYNALSAVTGTFTTSNITTANINTANITTANITTITNNPLTVSGLTVTNNARVNGTTRLVGDTTFDNNAIVNGQLSLPSVAGSLTVEGISQLNGGITVDTALTISGGSGDITTSGDLEISKTTPDPALISLQNNGGNNYNITVPNGSDMITIMKSGAAVGLTVTGTNVTIDGVPTINGNLDVNGISTFDNATFGNLGTGTGTVDIGDSLTVGNTLTLDGIVLIKSVATGVATPPDVLSVSIGLEADALFSRSDERLKENIAPIANAVTKVKALNGVSFNFKDKPGAQIGLIAQNVEKIIPEVVRTGSDGFKSVEYGHLVGLLIEAIKEQQAEIDSLKKTLADLQSQ